MNQKLTNGQVTMLKALAVKREEVIKSLREVAEAEQDQLKMLIKFYDLPEDKEYVVRQEGEEVFLVEKPQEVKGE